MIHLSPLAIQEICRLVTTGSQPENLSFRVGVQPGGCADLYYTLQPSTRVTPDDQVWERDGLTIVVDPNSLPAIDGTTLDYAEDLMGGGFRFHNPNAIATCGCGASFSLEATTISDVACTEPPNF
ncbi:MULTISPECIES: iron-sulfur cluster assembly accessory protein [unclassified Leptolyngbya]|uniref:HesB/IscA family protein n=1 Tax=unclassified Leptolyngbya TaxID=2650499 RepID=UPI00168248F5|nr:MULTISPECIES: iron-sulfur cluster assembly accessory protein [unclassified Leptolyngbya]MBD1909273.1 iron-sulfur cluster assembly accessory protein [Leptolyngbya sp. FACHB-8]MBD2153503.1 iron-sulfur cluster assembly accessory protein [Leptolyngbya sp. FACHB-16]